jgi:tetratricopeptide (TPR) repeat protein
MELGEKAGARWHWRKAVSFKGDFKEMSFRPFSEMTYYSALAREQLGKHADAKKLFRKLMAYAEALEKDPAKIDYFATSLPTMLLFEDDLQFRQQTTALFLRAQAHFGLGEIELGASLLERVLKRDPNHAMACDLKNQTSAKAQPKPRAFGEIIRLIPAARSGGSAAPNGSSEGDGKALVKYPDASSPVISLGAAASIDRI